MSTPPLAPEVKAKIVRLYVEEHLTIRLIRERLGHGTVAIKNALSEAGVSISKSRRSPYT